MSKITALEVLNDGMGEEFAGHLFDKIEGFAGYGFNKSHSVEYTLISYQAMFLKTYFPVEYFAATLSLVKDEKLSALLADAKTYDIGLDTPEINLATERFEILTDTRLMIPFSRIKGLSENAAKAIVAARRDEKGINLPFKSKEDFLERVNKRLINVAKVDILDRIGSFAAIEPTHAAIDSPSRIKDQRELIPGLVSAIVPVSRELELDEVAIRRLEKLYNVMLSAVTADGVPVRPYYTPKDVQFAIIMDSPSAAEEEANMVFMSTPSRRPYAIERIQEAMDECELRPAQAYWTTLVKRPKEGKQLTLGEIKTYKPFFDKELDIVRPPIIVLMGGTTVRQFLPDFKGKASDEAGTIIYSAAYDANMVIGFNPGEIWHAPEKTENLLKVFQAVQTLL